MRKGPIGPPAIDRNTRAFTALNDQVAATVSESLPRVLQRPSAACWVNFSGGTNRSCDRRRVRLAEKTSAAFQPRLGSASRTTASAANVISGRAGRVDRGRPVGRDHRRQPQRRTGRLRDRTLSGERRVRGSLISTAVGKPRDPVGRHEDRVGDDHHRAKRDHAEKQRDPAVDRDRGRQDQRPR